MLDQKYIGRQETNETHDFCCRHLESNDYEKMQRLIEATKVDCSSDRFLREVSCLNSPYELMKFYSNCSASNQEKLRRFAEERSKRLGNDSPLKLPDESLFLDMEKNMELEWILNSHCKNGGEIWNQAHASPDNIGWTRVVLR